MGISYWENLKDEEASTIRDYFERKYPGETFKVVEDGGTYIVLKATPGTPRQDMGSYIVSHAGKKDNVPGFVDEIKPDSAVYLYRVD